jgi:predicted O-methyltransferase YrrM
MRLAALDGVDGNVTERELALIAQLVSRTCPAHIFEIGTFDGRTTLNLAINSPESRIDTLDLPASDSARSEAPLDRHEVKYADKPRSGARYIGTDAEGRINQLYGDSGTFDFSSWYGKVDLIFIDGSHAYQYVINDSLHAIRMLSDSGGVIVWHDYGQWDGVTLALNDLQRSHSAFRDLVRVRGTTLAVLETAAFAQESPRQVPAAASQQHG